jgi:hypothetical protein
MLILTLIAASSFTATNIGDTYAARLKIMQERAALSTKLETLRRDRGAITEGRSPQAIEAAIQQEQPRIPSSNWKSSHGCTSVTLHGNACAAINMLRQAKADAERRNQLDFEIDAAETEFAKLPALVATDPGAEMAARLFTTASLGLVTITPETIQHIRIAGLTIAPATSGLLLFFAGLTWRTRREDEVIPPLV